MSSVQNRELELNKSIEMKFKEIENGRSVEFTTDELKILHEAFSLKTATDVTVGTPAEDDKFVALEQVVDLAAFAKYFCYVSLVKTLPSFSGNDLRFFRNVLDNFIAGLGPEPKGKDVLVNLCLMEMVLIGGAPIEALRMDVKNYDRVFQMYYKPEFHLKTMAKIAESKFRFQFKDEGGRLHVTNSGRCVCKDILCDHGWATRFILQAIAREGQTVGVDVDLSKLFITTDSSEIPRDRNSIQETPLSAHTNKTVDYGVYKVKPLSETRRQQGAKESRSTQGISPIVSSKEDKDSERMRARVSDDLVSMLEGHLDSRTEALENALALLMEERRSKLERQPTVYGSSATDHEESDVESTINPVDSSSVLGRYGKRYMNSGTVYNVGKNSTILAPVVEYCEPEDSSEVNVVRGFVKTDQMRQLERETTDRVYTINGLACPFKNARLNFLVHFHTALSTCGFDPKSEPIDALDHICTMKPQNPTEELIKQCVSKTFDFDEMSVIANPFKLPFIEVGMLVSESMLAKCLALLRSEYRNLWFGEMKCLRIPSFHDEFNQYSTSVMNRSSTRTRSKHSRRGSVHTSGESESGNKTDGLVRSTRVRTKRTLLGMPI